MDESSHRGTLQVFMLHNELMQKIITTLIELHFNFFKEFFSF